jgi:hypothetical protein
MNLNENINRIKQMMGVLNESDQVFPKGKYAYHITPDIFLDKIKQYGLAPKSESKLSYHPERIYLFMNPNMDKEMTNVLWNATKKETRDKIKDYYVLQIDLNQIPNHIFYNDPASSFSYVAIFTVQPIQNTTIKVIKKIPVTELKQKPTPEEQEKMDAEYERMLASYSKYSSKYSDEEDEKRNTLLDKLPDITPEEQEKMDAEYETLMVNLKNS